MNRNVEFLSPVGWLKANITGNQQFLSFFFFVFFFYYREVARKVFLMTVPWPCLNFGRRKKFKLKKFFLRLPIPGTNIYGTLRTPGHNSTNSLVPRNKRNLRYHLKSSFFVDFMFQRTFFWFFLTKFIWDVSWNFGKNILKHFV